MPFEGAIGYQSDHIASSRTSAPPMTLLDLLSRLPKTTFDRVRFKTRDLDVSLGQDRTHAFVVGTEAEVAKLTAASSVPVLDYVFEEVQGATSRTLSALVYQRGFFSVQPQSNLRRTVLVTADHVCHALRLHPDILFDAQMKNIQVLVWANSREPNAEDISELGRNIFTIIDASSTDQRKKNTTGDLTTAYLLAAVGGLASAHNFWLGRYSMAALQICLLGTIVLSAWSAQLGQPYALSILVSTTSLWMTWWLIDLIFMADYVTLRETSQAARNDKARLLPSANQNVLALR